MTLCNLDSTLVPSSCPDLQMYLQQLLYVLPLLDQTKFGEGAAEPTWQELADLWEGCAVPAGAMVFWHNTTEDTISWWICPTGDFYEIVN